MGLLKSPPKPVPLAHVNDDATVQAESEKLHDLESRYKAADAAYVAETERRAKAYKSGALVPSIHEQRATAMLEGREVEEIVRIEDLRDESLMLRAAVDQQRAKVQDAKREAFKPICADAKPEHVRLLTELIAAGEEFNRKRAAVLDYVSSISRRGGGVELAGPMQRFDINAFQFNQFLTAIQQLKTLSAHYRGEK